MADTEDERFPAEIEEALRAVDPLRRPDPFGLEAVLDAALASQKSATDASALAVSLAEELLAQCTRCDVIYTHNVLHLVERATVGFGEGPSDPGLRVRLQCVAASALTLDQSRDRASNLTRAALHLARADELGATATEPARLASALLHLARAAELAPEAAPGVDAPALYRRMLELTGDAGPACDLRAVALANMDDADDGVAAGAAAGEVSDPDVLAARLTELGDGVLPLAAAGTATHLGECLLTRVERGDGPRAIRWLQAAERSLYFHARVDPRLRARNQLGIARYFSVVGVEGASDQEYVHNKALASLQLAAALGAGDPDVQAECNLAAARVWANYDQSRAHGLLDEALTIEGVSASVRGRLHIDKAYSLAQDPERALPHAAEAIAAFEEARAANQDWATAAGLRRARELKAQLLESAEYLRTYRTDSPHLPEEALGLMSSVAAEAAEGGDLGGSYLAHRRMAIWCMDRGDFEQALVHYRNCRDVAQAMLDAGAHKRLMEELAEATVSTGDFEEARAQAMAEPSEALRAAHEIDRIAVQIAAIDHQVAAYCAARLGHYEEALEWALASRMRNLRQHSRGTPRSRVWTRESLEACGHDVLVLIPLVQEIGTIVMTWRSGEVAAVFPIEGLTHAGLRRYVYDAEDASVVGWITAYQEYERDTQFVRLAPPDDASAPHELWWGLLDDALARLSAEFAAPLHQALAAHGFADSTLLVVPPALLSLLPLHATELPDGRLFFEAHPTELGLTPSLPGRIVADDATGAPERRASEPPRSLLAASGDNELVYTSLELRAVARLFGEQAEVLDRTTATRDRILERLEGVECVHFASHGLFDTERWLDSRIELGGGQSITLREAKGKDLSGVRLVVLSACESGVSHVRGLQEEFLGFPAAFAMAGAQSVLGTLWRINDLSPALLLERFYESLLAGERAPVALRDARCWLRALPAGELVARARRELAAPRDQRAWRPVECSAVIGRFGRMDADVAPFRSPYHWAGFTLWSTE